MSIPLYEKRNANSLSINGFPSTYTTDSQDDCSTVAVTPIARRKVMKHASGSYSPSYHHNLSLSLYEYDELKYFRPLIHDRCPPSIEKGNIMKYDLIGINKAFTYSIHHDVINGNIDGCREKVQAKSSCVNSQDTFGKTALHYAIETEASNIVTYLLESNCNLNIGDNNGVTALHTAVKVGNLSLVQILLAEESINVNCVDNQGMAPLHLAAVTNKELICSELLTANAIVFIEDDDHMTPVAYAAKNGYGDLLRMFFSHVKSKGWEVDELLYDCGSPKTTLLHLAVQGSSLPAVKLLLRNNANVSSKRDSDGNTPVHVAAACGSLAIIRCLIGNTEVENNASSKDESHENIKINLGVEVINSEGATPLHEAAKFGHDVIVKYLISCGIDVNDIDIKKKTPLMVAAESGSMTTVKLLLEQSADVTILDRANKSCLHYSIGNYEIMKVILEHFLKEEKFKELVDAKDVTGSTALHYASKVGNSQEVLALLGAGANANSVNRFKETCFHVATCYGHLDILKILVKYQDEKTIDFMDDQDRTPLHVAAWNGYEDIISYLSSSNAHIKPDCDGRTPLHFAACNGHLKCLQLLVQRNVSAVNEADKQSETPLHIAAWSGHAKIVKYLLSLKKQMVTLNIRSQNPLDVAVVTKNEDVALAIIKHKRWRDFIYRTKTGNCTQIQILIARMPAAAKLLMDRCISIQGSPSQGNYKIIYEFEFLQGQPQSAEDGVKQSLQAFQTMVDYDRENCLVHPLSNALLKYKWDKYGWIAYLVNVLTFATFLTLLTYQIISNSIAYINDYPQMVECKNVTNLSLTNLHQSNLTGLNRTVCTAIFLILAYVLWIIRLKHALYNPNNPSNIRNFILGL
ncbi:Transient receptor potential cation channel subfamily A member 1 [Trichoplax sp. H2]|nr:Transient receptor potential cation channel subfamily A member 1 [Trichoplax sp. H2]|eukprot:RDD44631.1 Transient receptor potential cation channel subfamily A member 1 [Trichoplax sp. H2]